MFQQVNKKGTKKISALPDDGNFNTTTRDLDLSADLNGESDEDDSDDDVDDKTSVQLPIPLAEGKQWKKHVEENLRQWIETQGCRRDIPNRYFDNPPWTIKGLSLVIICGILVFTNYAILQRQHISVVITVKRPPSPRLTYPLDL